MTDKTDHRQKNLLNKTVEQVLPPGLTFGKISKSRNVAM